MTRKSKSNSKLVKFELNKDQVQQKVEEQKIITPEIISELVPGISAEELRKKLIEIAKTDNAIMLNLSDKKPDALQWQIGGLAIKQLENSKNILSTIDSINKKIKEEKVELRAGLSEDGFLAMSNSMGDAPSLEFKVKPAEYYPVTEGGNVHKIVKQQEYQVKTFHDPMALKNHKGESIEQVDITPRALELAAAGFCPMLTGMPPSFLQAMTRQAISNLANEVKKPLEDLTLEEILNAVNDTVANITPYSLGNPAFRELVLPNLISSLVDMARHFTIKEMGGTLVDSGMLVPEISELRKKDLETLDKDRLINMFMAQQTKMNMVAGYNKYINDNTLRLPNPSEVNTQKYIYKTMANIDKEFEELCQEPGDYLMQGRNCLESITDCLDRMAELATATVHQQRQGVKTRNITIARPIFIYENIKGKTVKDFPSIAETFQKYPKLKFSVLQALDVAKLKFGEIDSPEMEQIKNTIIDLAEKKRKLMGAEQFAKELETRQKEWLSSMSAHQDEETREKTRKEFMEIFDNTNAERLKITTQYNAQQEQLKALLALEGFENAKEKLLDEAEIQIEELIGYNGLVPPSVAYQIHAAFLSEEDNSGEIDAMHKTHEICTIWRLAALSKKDCTYPEALSAELALLAHHVTSAVKNAQERATFLIAYHNKRKLYDTYDNQIILFKLRLDSSAVAQIELLRIYLASYLYEGRTVMIQIEDADDEFIMNNLPQIKTLEAIDQYTQGQGSIHTGTIIVHSDALEKACADDVKRMNEMREQYKFTYKFKSKIDAQITRHTIDEDTRQGAEHSMPASNKFPMYKFIVCAGKEIPKEVDEAILREDARKYLNTEDLKYIDQETKEERQVTQIFGRDLNTQENPQRVPFTLDYEMNDRLKYDAYAFFARVTAPDYLAVLAKELESIPTDYGRMDLNDQYYKFEILLDKYLQGGDEMSKEGKQVMEHYIEYSKFLSLKDQELGTLREFIEKRSKEGKNATYLAG